MTDTLNTSGTLLGRLANNPDEACWEEFNSYYRYFIYLVIYRMQIRHHDAEELTQEILLKLWKTLPDFKYNPSKGSFRGWLCRVTSNHVRNFIRKKKYENEKLDNMSKLSTYPQLKSITIPEVEKIAEEEWKKYVAALAWENIKTLFSEKVCQAFMLLQQGNSREEVAEKLGMTTSCVSTYRHRVLNRMKEEINRLDKELNEI